jgi:hypothetical protein
METKDVNCLYRIQQVFGGYIKRRSGINAYRYRLYSMAAVLRIISAINGHIRNPIRIAQLLSVSNIIDNLGVRRYPFTFITAAPLTFLDGWLSGMFDSDGSIALNASNYYQLTVSVANNQ